ncbi:MAG: hypothetical protein NTX86_04515 [Candidatus Dependentiae bacterium]|nr:hypothetical protein [Candidatus Dependentiae bacterium]
MNKKNLFLTLLTGTLLLPVFMHTMNPQEENKGKNVPNQTVQVIKPYQAPFENSRKQFIDKLKAMSRGKVSEKYIQELEKEENKLMEEFFKIMKCNASTFNCWKMMFNDEFLDNQHEEESVLKKQTTENDLSTWRECILWIQSAMKECFIASDKVTINVVDGSGGSPLSAQQKHITIFDRDMRNHMSAPDRIKEREAIIQHTIRHEIQHILHDDVYIAWVMDNMEPEKGREKMHDLFVKKFSRFQEKRADILAALMHTDYAKAGFENFALIVQKNQANWVGALSTTEKEKYLSGTLKMPVVPESTHPSMEKRAEYLQQLHKEMVEELSVKKTDSVAVCPAQFMDLIAEYAGMHLGGGAAAAGAGVAHKKI